LEETIHMTHDIVVFDCSGQVFAIEAIFFPRGRRLRTRVTVGERINGFEELLTDINFR
jgi:hypothetical protein